MDGFKVVGQLPDGGREPGPSKWERAREFLRASAGEWCLLFAYKLQGTAYSMICRQRKESQPGFEFASRIELVDGKNVCRVYGRYTPPVHSAEPEAK